MNFKKFIIRLYGKMPKQAVFNIWTSKGAYSYDFSNKTGICRKIMELKKKGEIYYELCLQTDLPEQGKPGKAETAQVMPGIIFDLNVDGENLPNQQEAMQFIEELPLKPSMIVSSGGGYHLYFLFKGIWEFKTNEDRKNGEALSQKLHQYIIELGHKQGWKFNSSTSELNHLFRVPGTYNFKYSSPQEVAVLKYEHMNRYFPDEISEFLTKAKQFNLTDLGNAERMIYLHGKDMRYATHSGKWMIWNGKVWKQGEIYQRATETIESMCRDNEKHIRQHGKDSQSRRRLNAMISLAKAQPGISVSPNELDSNHWLLTCNNGTLDLTTGELRAFKRSDLITKMTSVTFDPDAACPMFQEFLNTAFAGNKSLIDFVQRVIGYTLTGSTKEKCMFLLYGTGSNGKSTLLEVIRQMLGDYANHILSETFTKSKNSRAREDIAKLRGRRFVTVSEIDAGRKLNGELIKDLTGGEPITARFLRQNAFQYYPSFKIFWAANNKPVVSGSNHGIWRRMHIIPFDAVIPERDHDLLGKLLRELSGILNWAIDGCLSWQRQGLNPPAIVKKATAEYRDAQDVIGKYLSERILPQSGERINKSDLYRDYVSWCEKNCEQPVTKISFSLLLKRRGFTDGKSTDRYWKDVKFIE